MKKFFKITLIVGLCLLLLGGIIFVIGLGASGWDIKALGNTQVQMLQYTETEELNTIVIDYENADIKLNADKNAEKIVIDYPQFQNKKGKNLSTLTVTETDGAIKISEKMKSWGFGTWDFTSPCVTVTLPASRSVAVTLLTNNGDISVNGNLQLTSLTAETDNGDVSAKGATISCSGDIRVESDNGDLTLGACAAQNVYLETDNGDIRIGGAVTAESVYAETDNGDISGDGVIDGNALVFDTDVGDVTLTIAGKQSDYAITVENDVGSSNVQTNLGIIETATRSLKVKSDVGDIHIAFTE